MKPSYDLKLKSTEHVTGFWLFTFPEYGTTNKMPKDEGKYVQ